LDGRVLRASGAGVVASTADRQQEKLTGKQLAVNEESRAKTARRYSHFLCPKPPLGSFTKAIGLGSTMPSWCSGSTHGFCIREGIRRLLRSQPRRLGFGQQRQARPRRYTSYISWVVCEATQNRNVLLCSKAELSTLL
jgi:hypothetical protein